MHLADVPRDRDLPTVDATESPTSWSMQALRTEISQLRTAMASRAEIEQAKGVVMALHRCSAEDAWQRMVSVSQHQNVKLRELARATTALVQGTTPPDATAAKAALSALLGDVAYLRPVLDRSAAQLVDQAGNGEHVDDLVAAADVRDQLAEARDHAARGRDHGTVDDPQGHAAMDRVWAGRDRDQAASDRAVLLRRLQERGGDRPGEASG